MLSNTSPSGQAPGQNAHGSNAPSTSHAPIASEQVNSDRKKFFLDLKENARGRFLKITEDVGGRRDTILLPADAAREFAEALLRLVEFSEANPQ